MNSAGPKVLRTLLDTVSIQHGSHPLSSERSTVVCSAQSHTKSNTRSAQSLLYSGITQNESSHRNWVTILLIDSICRPFPWGSPIGKQLMGI
jgi:hypothetical protein